MKIHILTDTEWNLLKRITDPMWPDKFAYALLENLNDLGYWVDA